MLEKSNTKITVWKHILASCSYSFVFLSLFSSYMYEKFGYMKVGRIIFMYAGLLCFFVAFLIGKKTEVHKQLRVVNTVALVVLLSLIPSVKLLIEWKSVYALGALIGAYFFAIINLISEYSYLKELRLDIKKVAAICAVFILLLAYIQYLRSNTVYFMWDAHILYDYVCQHNIYSLFDISQLSFATHVSYVYCAVINIVNFLLGDAMMALAFVGFLLYLTGIYGFYKCVCLFCGNSNKSVLLRILLTFLYACSPYMLGMMTYSYPDYSIWCLTPILVYSLFSNKFLLAEFISVCYVFTKEPAVISYAALVFGYYVCNVIRTKKIFYEFWRYVLLAIPGVLWLVSYYGIGHWTGKTVFAFNPEYALNRTLADFAINFNWLIVLIIIIVVIAAFLKKRRISREVPIFPVFFSMLAYYLFSILFQTVNHPRYVDALVAQLYLIVAYVIILFVDKDMFQNILTGGLVVLMALQSFITIDPMMLNTFNNLNVGKTTIVTTSEPLSDGMAYNRQYQGWGKIIDLALEDIVMDENCEIYMPAVGNNAWHFDAMGWYEGLGERSNTTVIDYWDEARKTRMSEFGGPGYEYSVHIVNDDHVFELEDDKHGYFIYSDLFGSEIADNISKQFNSDTKTFEYRGWIVYRIEFWN